MKYKVNYVDQNEEHKVKIVDFPSEKIVKDTWAKLQPSWIITTVSPISSPTEEEWADFMIGSITSVMEAFLQNREQSPVFGARRPIPSKDWFVSQIKEIMNQ